MRPPSLPSNAFPPGRLRGTVCGFPSSVLAGAARQGAPASGDLLALSAFLPCVASSFCTNAKYKSRKFPDKCKNSTGEKIEKKEKREQE